MSFIDQGPTDWGALFQWYTGAKPIIEDLDACRVIVDSMLVGNADTNCRAAEGLDALTRNAELWLLTNPCPEKWNGEHMTAVVDAYKGIGALVMSTLGAPDPALRVVLKEAVDEANRMLEEVRGMIAQLWSSLEL